MLLIGHALQLRFGEGKVALEMTIHMIRVNVSARAGDDLFIGQEVVTFLVLDGTSLARLWTGLNGKLDRRRDSSFLLTDAVDMLPDGRGANLLRMRFGQGKMALVPTHPGLWYFQHSSPGLEWPGDAKLSDIPKGADP